MATGDSEEKKSQIEHDLLAKFGEIALDSLDRFVLQTHLNDLADRFSQDRVKQAPSYRKSIFDEAIEQEFLRRDPTRKLKIPKNLRPKDKRVLSWEQLRSMLERTSRRDRVLLMLDMTGALRPSELFGLRWRSFDNRNTLSITETVYKGRSVISGKPERALATFIFPMVLPPNSCNGSRSVPIRLQTRSFLPTRRVASWIRGITETGFSNLWQRN